LNNVIKLDKSEELKDINLSWYIITNTRHLVLVNVDDDLEGITWELFIIDISVPFCGCANDLMSNTLIEIERFKKKKYRNDIGPLSYHQLTQY
jgi:hypothetical protein